MTVQLSLRQSPPSTPPSESTNTVAITSLPRSFFDSLILDLLYTHFSHYGEINQWVPLPGFGRIIVVYEHDQAAEAAKLHCDTIVLQATSEHPEVILRVFRADRNPLKPRDHCGHQPQMHYLQPPAVEKNFLISPPGSPPVGWEQIREDPPNATPLAADLISALNKLKLQEEEQERKGQSMLIHPSEAGVGVFVEDCDASAGVEVSDEDWVYGQTMPTRERWRPIPTAMPPMASISA
ncbi:calcineurin-binding protein [Coprinopsis cinerea okayama7|uniref:Calcineurin-binding protein n=1 Tax=Coprinopsis cinerea (strain Okayama-7 / 130 / ATCC MYA-4618 / FGSC 9003) TaxID=240176 RepID=A8P9V1_COPC7|nr:calcineurin-binding protein [Coprinopsis cinerea okayama7\|eukprot:XP_001839847.1 calcineurin-binding protein [Coprinopsis cinerea okayama7\